MMTLLERERLVLLELRVAALEQQQAPEQQRPAPAAWWVLAYPMAYRKEHYHG